MGFHIKELKNKKKPPYWKVQFITYRKDANSGRSTKNGKIKDIPKNEWHVHGFSLEMTLSEAKARRDQLNAQQEIKRIQEKRVAVQRRLELEDTVEDANLPRLFVDEFEREILFKRIARGDEQNQKLSKVKSHWRAARKTIIALQIEPKDWADNCEDFYNYFSKMKFSPSYVQKLLRILNLWGLFISKKSGVFYSPIPAPTGHQKSLIEESYFDKSPTGRGRESDPLTPELLLKTKGNIKDDNYNWLYLSVFLGLRPKEIDSLKHEKNYRVELDKSGIQILWVNQPKLTSLSRDKRWKLIPLAYPEQKVALEIIKSKFFRRPIAKVMKHHFGEHITLYGGRKGFTDLMLSKGENLEDISQWLGHTTIDRTWRFYKNKHKVKYTGPAKKPA